MKKILNFQLTSYFCFFFDNLEITMCGLFTFFFGGGADVLEDWNKAVMMMLYKKGGKGKH